MHKFGKGFATGVATMIGITAGVLLSFKKAVVEPIESQEQKADENRKKSMRKSGSSHLG
ncbi:DUF3042 domain-containing protein [Fructilactobacillus lindneri]|uniref:DUF3042 domain-containing protein n=1 Tax=Fructilactobacillus lindneri DSM 20690 = JCM 11027 TaxID=1122148 RepID=A0A0R2JWT5_9LACO|nr:DUF3042 family protein [Fructilactobacillus lindneri]KRN79066.1 hypothetical protein IV52_GL000471 [Fructilactobacillus lindneri DSM 20690 = JCM 11027]POG98654.1 DUF3042 domain-containing protein [Fructilactobacillus lindneri]POH04042.1 DUF3042 domain-containing protein [Fructilactobacillus lindneri]POH04716.1 DUF3042 domain-containing protein [Fructilactobacillus lindneri]POH07715.1 DUF3042 domain-containing protein [Fructilactobacillus lindneri]